MQFGGSRARRGRQGQWFLQHDTIPSRTSHQFLADKNIPVITKPPYSTDLAPSDFWLFPTLKMDIKGTCITIMEDVESNAKAKLRKIPKQTLCRCFEQ
jgi:hypothetical protein